MRVLILGRHSYLYSVKRLKQAARKLGHQPYFIMPEGVALSVSKGRLTVAHRNPIVSNPDAVIPRVGVMGVEYVLSAVRHFELMGIRTLNSSSAIAAVKDKFSCLQLLSKKGVPVPETYFTRSMTQLKKAIKTLGNGPVIMKFLKGSQGTGVFISETPANAAAILEAMNCMDKDMIVQKFLTSDHVEDIRVIVLGGKVIGSMKRVARKGEHRSNLHKGGKAMHFDADAGTRALALAAVKTTGLEFAGVDIMSTEAGSFVLEVNASPGFQGLEQATGTDIASLIVRQAVKTISGT